MHTSKTEKNLSLRVSIVTWIYSKGDTFTVVTGRTTLEGSLVTISKDDDVYSIVSSNSTFWYIHPRIGLVHCVPEKKMHKRFMEALCKTAGNWGENIS